jgi:hypothetical protein
MEQRLMVKQRLGEIPANATHPRMEVFTSALPGWYIFAPMSAPGISGTIHIPIQGSRLKPGWKEELA